MKREMRKETRAIDLPVESVSSAQILEALGPGMAVGEASTHVVRSTSESVDAANAMIANGLVQPAPAPSACDPNRLPIDEACEVRLPHSSAGCCTS